MDDMTSNVLVFIVGVIIVSISKFLYNRNSKYPKIIKEFQNKLPSIINQAKSINSNMFPPNSSLNKMNVYNSATHISTIHNSTINEFINDINNFNYRFVIFKRHYIKITNGVNRHKNIQAQNGNHSLINVQNLLYAYNKRLTFWDIIYYELFKNKYYMKILKISIIIILLFLLK